MLTSAQAQMLTSAFPALSFQTDVLLSKHTYFKIGGPADLFVSVTAVNDLEKLVAFCYKQSIPFYVLGSSSNVLVADEGVHRLVIKNATNAFEFESTNDPNKQLLHADSGVLMNVLVRAAIDRGLTGLEWFMGLPGTVGGAIVNNSHFVDQLVGNVTQSVDIVFPEGTRTLTQQEMQFAYDYSILHEKEGVVLRAHFLLTQGDKQAIQETAMNAVKKRSTTQPIGMPSSGCVFRNATIDGKKVSAGMLIDQAGLKGTKLGGAEVSTVHANFIVNSGGATAADVLKLADLVQQKVKEKSGIQLEKEIFVLQ